MMLHLYTRPRVVVTCLLCLVISTSLGLDEEKPTTGVGTTLAPTVSVDGQAAEITTSGQTTSAQGVSTTAGVKVTQEAAKHNQSTELEDSPDASAGPPVPKPVPAAPGETPTPKPTNSANKASPTQQVTTHTTQIPEEETTTKAQTTTIPAKRNPPTSAKRTTQAPTTPLQTTTQPVQTEAPVTTRRIPTEPPTQAPATAAPQTKPPVTESKAPVRPASTTSKPVTRPSSPARPAQTSRAPTTAQPTETEAKQPEHEDHEPTPKPSSESNKNDTGWLETLSHNSLFTKLMVPVVLGIVAASVIVCFAYGIKACRKRKSSRGRHKLIQNGKDHELGGNFDRMKLLADSSEDEF